MVHHEIDTARAALSRPGRRRGARVSAAGLTDEVHDARTAIKKARALARLVEPGVGREAKAAERALRSINRELSAVRDGQVLLETFDRLRASAGPPPSRKLAAARRVLAGLRAQRFASLTAARRRALVVELGRVRRQVAAWAPHDERWRSLARGLADVYRRGRRRMQAAYERDSADAFHAWRRAVKGHRYQIQILEAMWPDELGGRRDQLEKMGDWLGEEHDLAVLADTLREQRACDQDDEGCRVVLAALERRQRELHALARPLGERLFAEKPGAWVRRLHAYFRAFRQEEPGTAAVVVPPRDRVPNGATPPTAPAPTAPPTAPAPTSP